MKEVDNKRMTEDHKKFGSMDLKRLSEEIRSNHSVLHELAAYVVSADVETQFVSDWFEINFFSDFNFIWELSSAHKSWASVVSLISAIVHKLCFEIHSLNLEIIDHKWRQLLYSLTWRQMTKALLLIMSLVRINLPRKDI